MWPIRVAFSLILFSILNKYRKQMNFSLAAGNLFSLKWDSNSAMHVLISERMLSNRVTRSAFVFASSTWNIKWSTFRVIFHKFWLKMRWMIGICGIFEGKARNAHSHARAIYLHVFYFLQQVNLQKNDRKYQERLQQRTGRSKSSGRKVNLFKSRFLGYDGFVAMTILPPLRAVPSAG